MTSFIYFSDTLSASQKCAGTTRGHHPSRQLIQPLRVHSPSLRGHQRPPHHIDGKLHVPIPHGKGSPVVAWHGHADEAGLPVRGSHVALELGVPMRETRHATALVPHEVNHADETVAGGDELLC